MVFINIIQDDLSVVKDLYSVKDKRNFLAFDYMGAKKEVVIVDIKFLRYE
jgi:hypothetical protein